MPTTPRPPRRRSRQALDTALGAGQYTVLRTEAVGPKVGGELRQKAILAILLSFVAVLVYLAYRFEWRFGVAAVIATAHDILATLAFIGLTRLEVSLFVVAALLTIVGLLAQRHDRDLRPGPGESAPPQARRRSSEILNRSINETLPRTFFTGTTTLGSLVALRGPRRRRDPALRAAHALRRGRRHLLLDLHRLAGAAGDRAAVARAGRPWPPGAEARAPARVASRSRRVGTTRERRAGPSPPAPSSAASARRHPLSPRRSGLRAGSARGAASGPGPPGVAHIVVIGESPAASDRALALAATEPRLSATAGVHPARRRGLDPRHRRLASRAAPPSRGSWPRARWGSTTTTITRRATAQRAAFEAQLALAAEAGRPAVIHAREADDDVAAILANQPGAVAILHSFSSGPGLLRAGLVLRHYVSFSGMVTFKNWTPGPGDPRDAARPAAARDRRPVSGAGAASRQAQRAGVRAPGGGADRRLRGLPVDELIALTGANAARVFGLQRERSDGGRQ